MSVKQKKVYFVSLGCAKNFVDSEVMLGKLSESKYQIVERPEDADVIIINTCSFVESAKKESIEVILEMANYDKFLVVAGCMSQRYYKELEKEMPEVDLFIGTGEYHKIVEYLPGDASRGSSDGQQRSYVSKPTYIHSETEPRLIATKSYTSWLKVSEGCDRHCSFCIIPKIRGNLRSRSVDSLIQETTKLVNNGVKEINLIAQDLSMYGKDFKSEKKSLIELLNRLQDVEKLHWIRMLYFYPDNLNDEIIELMGSSKKICHYLDIPIQHLSNHILKKMNRKISREKIIENIKKVRTAIPDIVLRTSIIVGFPGEEDEHFDELVEGIKDIKFNHLGVFKYSDEEGTAANKLKIKVSPEVINKRYNKIYRLQKLISRLMNKKYIGKELEVLVDGIHEETDLLLQGRFYGQAPDVDGKVIINDVASSNQKSPKAGDFVRVKIEDFHDYDLVGGIL